MRFPAPSEATPNAFNRGNVAERLIGTRVIEDIPAPAIQEAGESSNLGGKDYCQGWLAPSRGVLGSQQMAFVDLTKQLAKEAFLSATKDPPAPAAAAAGENIGAIIFGQIHGLQKALKDDEELVVWFCSGGEKLRVMEIFLPSPKLAVLSGHDAERNLTRVISPVDALQLVAKVMKAPVGAKPSRVGLIMPKAKDSNG
jgi:hypothetical protein